MNFDWMWLYKEGSLYFEKIKLVKEKFHKVHIVYFKEFVNQTEKSLKEVCNFLGVSDLFLFDTRVKYSPSGKPKNFVFKHLSKRYGIFYKIRKTALYLLPREILERISNKFFKKYEIQKSEIQLIKRCINQDVDKLTELLGKDLSHWKK